MCRNAAPAILPAPHPRFSATQGAEVGDAFRSRTSPDSFVVEHLIVIDQIFVRLRDGVFLCEFERALDGVLMNSRVFQAGIFDVSNELVRSRGSHLDTQFERSIFRSAAVAKFHGLVRRS